MSFNFDIWVTFKDVQTEMSKIHGEHSMSNKNKMTFQLKHTHTVSNVQRVTSTMDWFWGVDTAQLHDTWNMDRLTTGRDMADCRSVVLQS